MHPSPDDPRPHLTCVCVNKDGTSATNHFVETQSDAKNDKNNSNTKQSAEKKPEQAKKKK